jgi:hypothetical protein
VVGSFGGAGTYDYLIGRSTQISLDFVCNAPPELETGARPAPSEARSINSERVHRYPRPPQAGRVHSTFYSTTRST